MAMIGPKRKAGTWRVPPAPECRLILRPESEIEGRAVSEVIQNILQQVAVPR